MMKRGPRAAVDDSALPFVRSDDDVESFARFCEQYIRLEKGAVMVLQDWQRRVVEMVWGQNRPKLAALSIGRGNSKSTLASALAVYLLYLNDEFTIDVLAHDQAQAGIIGKKCADMVRRHPELQKRCKTFQDHLVVRNSELWWLPATAAALEGRSADTTICDEGGRIDREVFEVASFSNSKKEHAQLLLLGTPGPKPDNVLAEFRAKCLENPDNLQRRYMEFSADQWRDHPIDCDDHGGGLGTGCLSAANPALGMWLSRESLMANLPPYTSEPHWRRVTLVQFWATGSDSPPLPQGLWDKLSTGKEIPPGTRVVLGFDGSSTGSDATVLVAATVSAKPHVQLVNKWMRTGDKPADYVIPVLEVEAAIRDACVRWDVAEIACDDARWQRTMAVLLAEGLPVVKFPQSESRMSAATKGFTDACRDRLLTHSGHSLIGEHLYNAVLSQGDSGRLVKSSRSRNAPRIDAAVAAVMAVSRAMWAASTPKKRMGAGTLAW